MRAVQCNIWAVIAALGAGGACAGMGGPGGAPDATRGQGGDALDAPDASAAPDASGAATYAPVAWGPLPGDFGGLTAYVHVPAGMTIGASRPLVVVLHGCWEDAATHATNSAWDALADLRHLYVVHAQDAQQSQQCFDWWTASSQAGDGDAAGVIAMIDAARARWSIDDAHVWLDGFSSGGALAVVLVAVHPDRFAGAIVHAGLPYRGYTGSDVGAAGFMVTEHDETPAQRAAEMPGPGRYPPIVAFVGAADTTVHPTFTRELVDQWTQVQGADQTPERVGTLAPDNAHHTYREYRDAAGRLVIATITIDGMAHGYAVDPGGTGADAGGSAAAGFGGHPAYGLDVGLWSTYWGAEVLGIR